MRNACDSSQTETTTLVFDPVNMCETRTETTTELTFPIEMTLAKTETDISFTEANPDLCCQQFGQGEQSFAGACSTAESLISTANIWDGAQCEQVDMNLIQYILPMAGDLVSSEMVETRSVIDEDNCIICNVNEDVAYTYDECTLMCQSATTTQTICTYTD